MQLPYSACSRLAAALRQPRIALGSLVQSCRFSNSSIANAKSRDVEANTPRPKAGGGATFQSSGAAIITGGSRGIGLAIATQLAHHGISCTLVGRDETKLQSAVEAVCQSAQAGDAAAESLATCRYVVGDVRDEATWACLFKNTPGARYLINSAGVSHHSFLARMTPASIRDVLDINLYGTILGCRAALRAWAREPIQDRCIVNMSSLLAVQGGYGASAYAASKAGVVALTRSLVDEGKSRQIRANVILPGYIESSMTDSITDAARADLIDRIPLRRFGLTDEVADAALFLVRNKYANNCSLNLDGGLSVAG